MLCWLVQVLILLPVVWPWLLLLLLLLLQGQLAQVGEHWAGGDVPLHQDGLAAADGGGAPVGVCGCAVVVGRAGGPTSTDAGCTQQVAQVAR